MIRCQQDSNQFYATFLLSCGHRPANPIVLFYQFSTTFKLLIRIKKSYFTDSSVTKITFQMFRHLCSGTKCSKLVFTVSKKWLATKSMQKKKTSKSAIDRTEKYAIFSNHDGMAWETSRVRCRMFYKNRKLHGCAACLCKKIKLIKKRDLVVL